MLSRCRMFPDPRSILSPYVTAGMTVIDAGCGPGYFTIPLSQITGKNGTVIAVDLQEKMLAGLKKYALKAGTDNIITQQCSRNSLQVEKWNGTADFALVFWMMHEVPDPQRLIKELYMVLSPKGKMLLAEPAMHVSAAAFENSLKIISESGFVKTESPIIAKSRTALFTK